MSDRLIYIADDEENICNIMRTFLENEGYEVETFSNGRTILKAFLSKPADMLIIDIMMPEIDGYSLCSAVRQKSNVPIIIVSAKDSEPDKIAGLTLGGDDYLAKPFSPMELVARVKSIFRRIEFEKHHKMSKIIEIADVTLNPEAKQAYAAGRDIQLTGMEFSLLYYLGENSNRAINRSELLDKIWGFESEVETRAIDNMIKRIRKKLADAGSMLKIETVWGFGFKIIGKE